MTYKVYNLDAKQLIQQVNDVNLWLMDPPYYGVVKNEWDNSWGSTKEFCDWFVDLANDMFNKTSDNGSLIFFCGVGPATQHAADLLVAMRDSPWFFRNWVTWAKRRAYGKSHDYLCSREEILWYSKSPERTNVTFNKPFTDVPSEFVKTTAGTINPNAYKRCTNVWSDLPEPLKAKPSKHPTEKPLNVMNRLVLTHSNEGDLIVDPFGGSGATGEAALNNNRNVVISDIDKGWSEYAENRLSSIQL